MGHRHDDRSSRIGPRPAEHTHGRGREEPRRVFDRNEDMGGAGWSGASGRGGMSYGGQPGEGGGGPSVERGYGRESYGRESYGREGGYGGYPSESGAGYGDERRFSSGDEGVFLREQGYGHVPGQRWSGGYGGDRDRVLGGPVPPQRDYGGRGFTGSDFGPSYSGSGMGMGAALVEERGPHYGKGPKGYKRSDDRTHEDICEVIAHQGHIDASDVEVKVESGIVTLSGTVAHRHEKRALEHLVERCRGVDDVHNELRLKRDRQQAQQRDGDRGNGKNPRSS
jgi:hypothetical protein